MLWSFGKSLQGSAQTEEDALAGELLAATVKWTVIGLGALSLLLVVFLGD
jgi:hypothetical protein